MCGMVRLRELRGRQAWVHGTQKLRSEYVRWSKSLHQIVVVITRRHFHRCVSDVAPQLARDPDRGKHGCNRFEHSLSDSGREIAIERIFILPGVALVAAKKLIAAVPAEQRPDAVILGQPGAVVRWHCGGIAEGLVVNRGNSRDRAHDIVRRNVVLTVPRSEMACRNTRIAYFIETRRTETDGVRARGFAGDLSQHSSHRGAVRASAEESTHRTVLHSI